MRKFGKFLVLGINIKMILVTFDDAGSDFEFIKWRLHFKGYILFADEKPYFGLSKAIFFKSVSIYFWTDINFKLRPD